MKAAEISKSRGISSSSEGQMGSGGRRIGSDINAIMRAIINPRIVR
jgi:hypothetical protein